MWEHSDIAVFVEAVDARMVEAPSLNVVALDIFGARVRKTVPSPFLERF